MFDITEVELEDFRSFRGKHSFAFPTEPGLYAVTGKNLDNPQLGSNGIGKTSLFEAIRWCNYGSTSRGLKAGDIINWGAKSCSVTVHQFIGNEDLTVTRTQSPNSLRLNGTIVDQETLEKHLRLGPEAFTYAVMIPQFGEFFFDKSPSDKLALFSQIMELDYWLTKSKEASVLAGEIEHDKNTKEHDLTRSQGQLETLNGDLEELLTSEKDFSMKQSVTIRKIEAELREVLEGIARLKAKNTSFDVDNEEQRIKLVEKIKALKIKGVAIATDINSSNVHVAVAEKDLQGIKATLKNLSGLTGKCPTCLQNVSSKHLKDERDLYTTNKRQIEVIIADAISDRKDKIEHQKEVDAKIVVCENELNYLLEKIEANKQAHNKIQTELTALHGHRTELKVHIEAETSRENPFTRMIKDKKYSIIKTKAQIEELKDTINKINEEYIAVEFWVSGFKRIRLMIIEETLSQLEVEVNNNLASLGLMDWRIEFDIERENKSGGITKGFTVLVHVPDYDEPVKLESWSGGESQRIMLAGDLGLANLIMERAGLVSKVEFYDEPSTHLSVEGQLDLADTLNQRALNTGKVIWMVDHNTLDFGDFAKVLMVTMDDKGSSLHWA